ncbi:MAG: helix-turn-helix domain-containing protein [Thermoplasmata archaeon]
MKILLEKHFGSCRFVYNYFLAKRDEYYITHKDAEKSSLSNLNTQNMLIELKEKYLWLYEVNSQSLQMSLRFLDNAFKNIRKMRLIKVGGAFKIMILKITTSGFYGIFLYRQQPVVEAEISEALAEK